MPERERNIDRAKLSRNKRKQTPGKVASTSKAQHEKVIDKIDTEPLSPEVKKDEEDEEEEEDFLARTRLDLSNNPMPPVDGLTKTIAQFVKLQKLDISGMKESSTAGNPNGLTNLQWLGRATKRITSKEEGETTFGDRLTWLKMTDNPGLGEYGGDDVWNGLEKLKNLTVLNASTCSLTIAPPPSILLELSSLCALILAHNNLSTLSYIPHLPQLNTLVLSHNKIKSLPKDLPANLPSLKKLSITHNSLEWIKGESPLPDFSPCSHLREIRLAGNSRLGKLPSHLSTWGRGEGREKMGTGLETLELADCGLNDFNSIEPLLKMRTIDETPRRRRGVGNLSLKDNEVAKLPLYQERIMEVHTSLRTLDGEKVVQQPREEIKEKVATVEDLNVTPVAPVANGVKREKKKGKREEREEGEKKEVEKEVVSPVVEQSLSTDKAKLQRKRGKRGGGGTKAEIELSSNGQALPTKKQGKKKNDEKAEKVVSHDEAKHVGAASHLPAKIVDKKSKKQKEKKQNDPERKSAEGKAPMNETGRQKKRKAWDHQEEHVEKKAKLADIPQEHAPTKPDKAQTSVAAVIQMGGKKGREAKPTKSVWGQVGVANSNFGDGSAWD